MGPSYLQYYAPLASHARGSLHLPGLIHLVLLTANDLFLYMCLAIDSLLVHMGLATLLFFILQTFFYTWVLLTSSLIYRPLAFIWLFFLHMGLYFSFGFLFYMGLRLVSTLATTKIAPQSQPFYRYTNTAEYLCLCQRRFLSPALRKFSIWIYLNIVSAIFHFWSYKPSSSYLWESLTYSKLRI